MNALARLRPRPRGWRLLLDLAIFQAAWFACVAFAARDAAAAGMAAVGAAVILHLLWSDEPGRDAGLVTVAMGLGLVWDTLAVRAGWVQYASPGPVAGVAPAWILALWALFATTLRDPLRWLHGRPWLAAAFGGVGGPLSYAAAARLGACSFPQPVVSMLALGAGWALMTPLLVGLARRLDAAGEGAAR